MHITPPEFATLMAPLGPWPATRRIAVAVSGGADSLCLAWLARAWGNPLALIVDHALRAGSAAEAANAARTLARFGVPARILTLTQLRHGPGVAARARAARYAALAEAMRAEGLCDLLLAHHARDQAETLMIRRARGSDQAGLAGMAPVREMATMRLLRPLLPIPPGRLRATLRAAGVPWAEDPSNADPRATRTRMRTLLDDAAGDGPAITSLCGEARARGRARAAAEQQRAAWLAARVSLYPEAFALISPGDYDEAALAALIQTLGGAPYAPRRAALRRLAAALATRRGATLGGVIFTPAGRLGPGLLAAREPHAVAPPVPAIDGARWDGRFELHLEQDLPPGATLGALGAEAVPRRQARDLPALVLPALVLHGLPCLRAPGLPALPAIAGRFSGWTNARIGLSLTPGLPVAGAFFHTEAMGDVQRHAEHHIIR